MSHLDQKAELKLNYVKLRIVEAIEELSAWLNVILLITLIYLHQIDKVIIVYKMSITQIVKLLDNGVEACTI